MFSAWLGHSIINAVILLIVLFPKKYKSAKGSITAHCGCWLPAVLPAPSALDLVSPSSPKYADRSISSVLL